MEDHAMPRVVVENNRASTAEAQRAALEAAGFAVTVCAGPGTLGASACLVVEHGRCPWLDEADVLLHDLDPDNFKERRVLREVRRSYPDLPIVLELPEATAVRHAERLAGCHVVPPRDMQRLVEAVAAAAD